MPSPLAELFSDLDTAFEKISSEWYVFGAQAAIIHGAARLTADVDVTLMYGDRSLDDLVTTLQNSGFDMRSENPTAFAERTRVLPTVHIKSGLPVDIVLGGPGLEEEFTQRASRYIIEGISVPVTSPEDLVTMKIFSGRDKDLDDALAVIKAQGTKLNIQQVRTILAQLETAMDRSDLIDTIDELIRRSK